MEDLFMKRRRLTTALCALPLALACLSLPSEARNMSTPRIDQLFATTKPVCFGRFVMDVPTSATVVTGPQAFGPDIESLPDDVMKRPGALQSARRGQSRARCDPPAVDLRR